jgi:hypothetical protein
MTAVLADLRELPRPLSALAAFQLGHFLSSFFTVFNGVFPAVWLRECLSHRDLQRERQICCGQVQ